MKTCSTIQVAVASVGRVRCFFIVEVIVDVGDSGSLGLASRG
jgi:hypothetical protein